MPPVAGPNGSSSVLTAAAVRDDPEGDDMEPPSTAINGARAPTPDTAGRRPSSAPGSKQNLAATFEHAERQELVKAKGLTKPLLLRSRSEHAGLLRLDDDTLEDEIYEWGRQARFRGPLPVRGHHIPACKCRLLLVAQPLPVVDGCRGMDEKRATAWLWFQSVTNFCEPELVHVLHRQAP